MPYHIDVMTFRADLKDDGYAFLSSPHFVYSDDRDRMISTHGYITMPLTDIDQELLQENYEVSIYEYGTACFYHICIFRHMVLVARKAKIRL